MTECKSPKHKKYTKKLKMYEYDVNEMFFFNYTMCCTYSTDAGYVAGGTDAVCQQTVAYFPGEVGRALALVVRDRADDVGGRHARLTATDGSRTN